MIESEGASHGVGLQRLQALVTSAALVQCGWRAVFG